MDDLRFTGLADERAENYVGTDEDEEMVDSEGEGEGEGHFGESDLAAEDEDDLGNDDEPQPPFNPIALGLKEIGGLAHFRVSSYKPGNGVEELISDDTDRYWQYVATLSWCVLTIYSNKLPDPTASSPTA